MGGESDDTGLATSTGSGDTWAVRFNDKKKKRGPETLELRSGPPMLPGLYDPGYSVEETDVDAPWSPIFSAPHAAPLHLTETSFGASTETDDAADEDADA